MKLIAAEQHVPISCPLMPPPLLQMQKAIKDQTIKKSIPSKHD
jgi:hypothetical protein